MLLRYFLLTVMVFSSTMGLVQTLIIPNTLEYIKVPRKSARDPKLLANYLTQNDRTELEKINHITAWINNEFHYNFSALNSSKGFSAHTSASYLLKKKTGTCLDFAHLFDTLCFHAGINSYTVTGYLKDNLFDVGDSLAFANHAWNAVSIDGRWYLLDLTSVGYMQEIMPSKFCSVREKWNGKWFTKTKTRIKYVSYKSLSECGKKKVVLDTLEKTYIKFIPSLLIQINNLFVYRYKSKTTFQQNYDYYLAPPENFVLTHFPTDKIWSLQNEIEDRVAFSNDSSYFHRFDSGLLLQEREGRLCVPCDDFLRLDTLEKLQYNIVVIENQRLIDGVDLANQQAYIGDFYTTRYANEKDSLLKKIYYDSAFHYYKLAGVTNRGTLKTARYLSSFQKKKNKKKNRDELRFQKSLRSRALSWDSERKRSCRKIISISNGYESLLRINNGQAKKLERKIRNAGGSAITLKDEKAALLQQKNEFYERQIDSLQDLQAEKLAEIELNARNILKKLETNLSYLSEENWRLNTDLRFLIFSELDIFELPVQKNHSSLDSLFHKHGICHDSLVQSINGVLKDKNEMRSIQNQIQRNYTKLIKNTSLLLRGERVALATKDSLLLVIQRSFKDTKCAYYASKELYRWLYRLMEDFKDSHKEQMRWLRLTERTEMKRRSKIDEQIKLEYDRVVNVLRNNGELAKKKAKKLNNNYIEYYNAEKKRVAREKKMLKN